MKFLFKLRNDCVCLCVCWLRDTQVRKCSVPMNNYLLGWGEKILWRIKFCLNCCTVSKHIKHFLFGHRLPTREQVSGESRSKGERVGQVWSKVGKFPALGESAREYPQNSAITWHKFNFLFLNLLKHFLKSKPNKYSNNNKKSFSSFTTEQQG